MAGAYLEYADRPELLVALKGSRLVIGSSSESDIVVSNPTVSRRHAIFTQSNEMWCLEDAGSTNGTWVNGRRLATSKALHAGDHIALGGARFFFRNIESPAEIEADQAKSTGVLLAHILALSPYDFEKLTCALFVSLGFEALVTKQTGDGGVDVEATNNGIVFRGKYLIQCKRYKRENRVGSPEIQRFFGRVASEPGAKGIFVTSSRFSRRAREFAESVGINLIEGDELERMVARHRLL